MELDQSRVTDPEVMRDLVEHDVSNLAAYTIGVAGSESRDRPAEDADLVGKHSAVRAAPSRQRYAAVQPEQRLPVGRLVLDDDLDVAHRRTEIGREGAQRVVNRLFERIIETRRACSTASALSAVRSAHRPQASPKRRSATWFRR